MVVEAKYIVYDLFNYFLNNTVDLFFRQIQPRGSHLIPQDGPVFFVGAPHANQFVDPLVLQRHTGRRIFYLIAKKSYDRPLVGAFARVTHSIPVARPQDSAFKGTGKIQIVERYNNPTLLNGINTRFTKDLGPGFAITFPRSKITAEVEEVLSDTEVRIKVEIKDLVALEALTQQGGTTFKVIPRINQNEVYQSVYDTLKEGNCVGIFPEGGSHDRTELLPLKAGIAVMALGAMAHYPGLNVKIVPCGMNYFHPDKFRSRAVVEYGKPITITQDLVEKFKQGGVEKREACSELLSTVSDALKAVTLNTPDYETLMVIQAARRLYRPKNKKFKITRVTELNRRLVAGYLHYKDEPRIQEIKAKVLDYNKQLRTFGIRDHQVKNTTLSRLRASFRLFRRVIGLMFMAALALPGSILASPIIIAASIVSKQKQKEALATSSVKIRAKDVISSWKILIALGLGPLVYTIYSVIITYLVSCMNVNRFFVWITPIISLIILPMITYISLIFGERGFDIYRSLPPLFLCMLGDPAVKTLPQTREELSNEITAIINELGPQLFPELDHTRTFDEHNNEYTPLTPGSVNALNWIMSPFELIGERLFSDYSDAENGSSLSRNTSHTDLPKLAPLSSLSSSNIKLKLNKHEEILSDNINVEPPSPKTQTDEQTPIEDKKDI